MKKHYAASFVISLLAIYGGYTSASAAVGKTQGNFMVAADGSASYSIPLWSPPGVRGLQPRLSLAYNSNSGNGLLGMGWSLSGMSVVIRCDRTIAQDGSAASAVLDATDRFCIDGNRLRATSGTYGAPDTSYQTEVATFSKIFSRSAAGTGPAWFEVKGKDGLTYEYGHTADSAIVANGSSTVSVWALSAVRDRSGNSMLFTYINDTANGSYRPSSIQYTFTGGSSSNNNYKVDFTYEPRAAADTLWTYAEGGKVDELNRLHDISVKAWNGSAWAAVRVYTLAYANSPITSRTRLTSVQECAMGDCLPATTIGYQDGETAWGSEIAQSGNLLNMPNAMPVDINGDGKTDLVYADQATGRWFYHLGQSSGVFQGPYDSGLTSANYTTAFPMDYDANGATDILVQNASGNWRVMFFQSAGSGFTYTDTTVPAAAAAKAMARDLDGDGREDLLYAVATTGWAQTDYVYYRLNTASGFGAQNTFATFTNCATCLPRVKIVGSALPFSGQPNHFNTNTRVVDFNQDGRADIFMLTSVCYADTASQCGNASNPVTYRQSVYLSQAGGGYVPLDLVTSATGTPASLPLAGDFNGDNCTDVAYTVSNSWRLQFGTCYRAGATAVLTPAVSTGILFQGLTALAVDWDGDGRTDIIQPNNASPRRWTALRSTGSTLSSAVDLGINYPTSSSNTTLFVGDFNGDGLDDLLYSTYNGTQPVPLFTRIHNGVAPDLANSFTDGFGINASTTYISPAHNNYTKGTGSAYPEKDITPKHAVVQSVTSSDGAGGTFTQQYWYYYARENLQGRGFEGFGMVRSLDSRSSIYSYSNFRQQFPYTGLVQEASLYQPDNSTLIQRVVNTPATTTLDATPNNQRVFPYISQSTRYAYEVAGIANGALITQEAIGSTYDTFGNLIQIDSVTTDKDTSSPFYSSTYERHVTNTITNDQANWCIGLPSAIANTNLVPGAGSITRTTSFAIDYVTCRQTQEIVEPGNSTLEVNNTFGFDSFGNVNSVSTIGKTAAGGAMAARTTQFSYGTRGLFPESTTNSLLQTTTFGYRYDLGMRTSITDPNGIAESAVYDDFGHITRVNRADGTGTDFEYQLCSAVNSYCTIGTGNSDLRWGVTLISRTTANAEVTRYSRYFDGMDRPRWDASKLFNAALSYTYTTYDSLGRISRKSVPYNVLYNGRIEYSYDLAGRIVSELARNASNVVDRQTTYEYAGRKVSTIDPKNNRTEKIQDVWGALRRVIDPSPGGTTNYAYDSFGNLVSVVDAAGNTNSQTFTIRGVRTSSLDIDRGSWTFTANSLGEYATQLDAKGNTTYWSYDALGRLVSRSEPEGMTTWTWGTDPIADSIGSLASVTSPGGYGETYWYDAAGRTSKVRYTLDTNYDFDFQYGDSGLPSTLTYPQSTNSVRLKVQYSYTYGVLSQVRDFTGDVLGATYWTLNATDERGNVISESLANGVRIGSGFDPLNGDLSFRTSGNSASFDNHQNLAFTWDKNGNLTDRIDANQSNLTEHSNYDALNRLTSSTLNGATNLSVWYDSIGNITRKSENGADFTYTYNLSKKHAVASTSNGWAFTYDQNGNALTSRGGNTAWYSYNQPSSITMGGQTSQFSYGANRNYWKQVASYPSGQETTFYVGNLLEKVVAPTTTDFRHKIVAGTAQIVVTRRVNNANDVYYITKDHIGSGSVVTNSAGTIVVKQSFSAYGRRRGTNWQGSPTAGDWAGIAASSRSGYTGHTSLDNLGLVHMNGRVYDPEIGGFTSADPVSGQLDRSQSWNKFSYVESNPLTMFDPSGFKRQKTFPHNGPADQTESQRRTEALQEIEVNGYRDRPAPVGRQTNDGYIQDPNPIGELNQGEMEEIEVKYTPKKKRIRPPQAQQSCVNYKQVFLGAAATGLGGARVIGGFVESVLGLATADVTLGASLLATARGTFDMSVGGMAVVDGLNIMDSGFNSVQHGSTPGAIGEAIGGETGRQLGEAANLGLAVKDLADVANKRSPSGIALGLANQFVSTFIPEAWMSCQTPHN